MKRFINSVLFGLVLIAIALLACKSESIEGKYNLDKAAMRKTMEAEIAKMSEEEKEFGKLGLELIDAMEMTIELKSEGAAQFTVKVTDKEKGGESKSETKPAKWTKTENTVTIEVEGGDKLDCTLDGNKLTCKDEKQNWVFVKS